MKAQRQEHASQPTVGLDGWSASRQGEPRLEELMEDPIMGLIWRRDGLEPNRVRETMHELRAIVRAARETVVKAA